MGIHCWPTHEIWIAKLDAVEARELTTELLKSLILLAASEEDTERREGLTQLAEDAREVRRRWNNVIAHYSRAC